jgi:GNAT superfamily N-acetyltransferase
MLRIARSTDLALVRTLLLEYAGGLGIDLTFQKFDEELATLPGDYDPILVAHWNEDVAGCVALRRIDETTCEMKRLYVRPPYRGHGVGRALAERIITEARIRGFRAMRLDTLPSMQEAARMYEQLGFRDIPPYRFNPIKGSRFMELKM